MIATGLASLIVPRVDGPIDLPRLRAALTPALAEQGFFAEVRRKVAGDRSGPEWASLVLPTTQLWWVDKDASALLHGSTPNVPDETTLDIGDVYPSAGLAVFAEPFYGLSAEWVPDSVEADRALLDETERREHRLRCDAMLWGPVNLRGVAPDRAALGISFFKRYDRTNIPDIPDPPDSATYDAIVRTLRSGVLYSYLGRTDWIDGNTIAAVSPGSDPDNETLLTSMIEDRKCFAALMAIARAQFVAVNRWQPKLSPNKAKRKRQLHDYDPDQPVHVMSLRPPQQTDPEGHAHEAVNWRHSWIVSPHWRWQPYGRGRQQRRLTLIGAYRKGPADAPLLGSERVFRIHQPKGQP